MTIDFCDDLESKYKAEQAKLYSASSEDMALINKTINKLHEQKQL